MHTAEKPSLIPIVIGVTGHRNINSDDPRLVQSIRKKLLSLRASYPHSPFIFLTSLAEGSDQLIPRIAQEVLQARVIATLPFPPDLYEEDFQTAKSREEFRHWLAQADPVHVCAFAERTKQKPLTSEERLHGYARAGAYVSAHCHLLMAIWDGKPARGIGGTAEVVAWKLSGEIPAEYSEGCDQHVLWPSYPGTVLHLDPASYELRELTSPQAASPEHNILGRIDQLNGAIVALPNAVEDGLLVERLKRSGLLEIDPGLKRLFGLFRAMDTLAAGSQKSYLSALLGITLIFFAAISFSNQPATLVSTILFLVFMMLLLVGDRFAARSKVETRFFDYRALAEGLRVAMFWRLAGIHRHAYAEYLYEDLNVLSWVRHALLGAEMSALPSPLRVDDAHGTAMLRELWIEDQAEYFKRKTGELRNRLKLLSRWSTAGFIASWLVAAARLATLKYSSLRPLLNGLIGIGGVIIAAAITLEFYKRKRTMEGTLKRSALGMSLFGRAALKLDREPHRAREVFLQLGREALRENADWLRRSREIPFKPRR